MTNHEYQDICETTAIYPGKGQILGLLYTTLGLGEAGEVQNKVKKLLRDNKVAVQAPVTGLDPALRQQLMLELGDLLWYVTETAQQLGFTLEEVMLANGHKLLARKLAKTLGGAGDER